MSNKKNILFLLNPISGIGKKGDMPDLIKKYVGQYHDFEIRHTEYRKHGEEIADAEKTNFDAIVAIGGDGTVNEIGGALADSNCAMGIVPAGSGNGLARHLKIPLNIKSALERIVSFEPQAYDTGKVNDRFFAGTCGFGFDAYIAQEFDKYPKRGFLSYAKLIAKEYKKYKAPSFHITIDGETISRTALVCAIANSSQFGNGFTISPDSNMQDGQMELIFLQKFMFVETAAVGTKFFTQTIDKSRHFECIPFKTDIQIEVESDGTVYFHLDGEPFEETSQFKIRIAKSNLKIL